MVGIKGRWESRGGGVSGDRGLRGGKSQVDRSWGV